MFRESILFYWSQVQINSYSLLSYPKAATFSLEVTEKER